MVPTQAPSVIDPAMTTAARIAAKAAPVEAAAVRTATRWVVLVLGVLALLGTAPLAAQTPAIDAGVGYLGDRQEIDGSWTSSQVRRAQATTEALRALQLTGRSPAARAAAADLLQLEPIADTDDRARRVEALLVEGRSVVVELQALLDDAAETGGWGLSSEFAPQPLDTSLALLALTAAGQASSTEAFLGLVELVGGQEADGGWACVPFGDSDVSCTARALLAIAPFRALFNLDGTIGEAVAFLRARFQADGSLDAASLDLEYATAQGVRALLAVGDELPLRRALVTGYLESRQVADGSWQSDPFLTAVVVRALHALATAPFCGDALLNTPREACDGLDFGGATCESAGFGPGTLACDASCRIVTDGCDPAPVCGDGAINQPGEACDGSDLDGQTCEALGFGGGDLACSSRCTFDTDACTVLPVCGDGFVNQDSEACDGADLGGASCASLGLGDGPLACSGSCRFDASGCSAEPVCGDGVVNSPLEVCDGGDLSGNTCASFGGSGDLSCSANCATFDVAGCSGLPDADGDGFPAGADCDDTDPDVNPGQTEITLNRKDDDCDPRTPDLIAECAVEVVFLMDTSGSMNDDAAALCSRISQVESDLSALGIEAASTLWGITQTRGGSFSCLTSTVSSQLGGVVPGDDGSCDGFLNQSESWGQGSAIVADRFPWTPDAIRVVIPISDEGPCNGNFCSTNGSDGDSAANAAAIGLANEVFLSPIVARGGNSCVSTLATRMADTTGGQVFFSTDPNLDLAGGIADLLIGACEDTRIVTVNPALALNPPGTEHEVEVLVTNSLGLPLEGEDVEVEIVSGPNAGALGGFVTGAGGVVPVAYTGNGVLGVDTIVATAFDTLDRPVLSEPALKFWDLDCNENGAADTCDLSCDGFEGACAAVPGCGTSADVDADGEPDECLLPSAGTDDDDDGFPVNTDCDDQDPSTNPGQDEVPGNGTDDDCNPTTPDVVPPADVSCSVTPDATGYGAQADLVLDVRVLNDSDELTLVGLEVSTRAEAADGAPLADDLQELAPLVPGDLRRLEIVGATGSAAPGPVALDVTVRAGDAIVATCAASTEILTSTDRGPAVGGTIEAVPDDILAGEPAVIDFTVTNVGNVDLDPAFYEVLIVDPATDSAPGGTVLARFPASDFLAVGDTIVGQLPMPELPAGDYLLVLQGGVDAAGEGTLAFDGFRVVNTPPDCSGLTVDPDWLWPPNHKFVALTLDGVVDPDGDPVTLTVTSIFQDEPTNATGDGNTCVDARGVGTATPEVRRERSGNLDGRVYHVAVEADDGRGGTCQTVATVCVPHDRRDTTCVDQGPLYDSTVCP